MEEGALMKAFWAHHIHHKEKTQDQRSGCLGGTILVSPELEEEKGEEGEEEGAGGGQREGDQAVGGSQELQNNKGRRRVKTRRAGGATKVGVGEGEAVASVVGEKALGKRDYEEDLQEEVEEEEEEEDDDEEEEEEEKEKQDEPEEEDDEEEWRANCHGGPVSTQLRLLSGQKNNPNQTDTNANTRKTREPGGEADKSGLPGFGAFGVQRLETTIEQREDSF